jgi:hypothetical protein
MSLIVFLAHLLPGVEFLAEPLRDSHNHKEGMLQISPQNLCCLDVALGKIGAEEIRVGAFL